MNVEMLRLEDEDPTKEIYQAKREGQVLGQVTAKVIDYEAEIYDIFVEVDVRGQGIGRKLFSHLLQSLQEKGVQVVFLEVRETNLPAIKIYETSGFVPYGRRENYYKNPREDAILMRKELCL